MCQTPASNPLPKLRLRTLGGRNFPGYAGSPPGSPLPDGDSPAGPARPKRGNRFGKHRIPGALPLWVKETRGLHQRVTEQRLPGKVCHGFFRMSRSILASASSRLSLERFQRRARSWDFDFPSGHRAYHALPENSVRRRLGGYGKLPRRLPDRPRLLDHLLYCLLTMPLSLRRTAHSISFVRV